MKQITMDGVRRYRQHLVDEEKSEVTINKYFHDIVTFFKWQEGRALTKELLLEYKAKLVECYAPATVNSILASLNSYFTYNEWFAQRTAQTYGRGT